MISVSRKLRLLTVLLFILPSDLLHADGKIYINLEKVPTTIPYQRAAILFDKGQQTLILQSQYEVPGNPKDASLCWIVPVPSVPDIASMDADIAETTPFRRLDIMTRPDVIRFSDVFVCLWLVSLGGTPILLIASLCIKNPSFQRFIKRIENPYSCLVLTATVIGMVYLFMGARAWKGGVSVEILKSQKAGIHDVQVIKSDTVAPLLDWFKQHGFKSGPEDKAALQAYIDRGWCFVASKIDPITDPKDHSKVSNHLLAPLVLRFPTPHPVYPTALTATGGHNTEILIYLASGSPFGTTSPIELRYHKNEADDLSYYTGTFESPERFLFQFKYLSKYKGTLTPAQMEKDIEFLPGPEIPDYRERAYAW